MNMIHIRKGVAICIIILLTGVVIQPVISVEIKQLIFDNESVEDCGCEIVNNNNDLFRVRLLLARIKVVTNFIMMKYSYTPEIKENCQKILTDINSNIISYNENICMIVWILYCYLGLIAVVLMELFDIFEYYKFQLIAKMILTIATPIVNMIGIILEIGDAYDCFDFVS